MTSYPYNINSPRGLSPLRYFHSNKSSHPHTTFKVLSPSQLYSQSPLIVTIILPKSSHPHICTPKVLSSSQIYSQSPLTLIIFPKSSHPHNTSTHPHYTSKVLSPLQLYSQSPLTLTTILPQSSQSPSQYFHSPSQYFHSPLSHPNNTSTCLLYTSDAADER